MDYLFYGITNVILTNHGLHKRLQWRFLSFNIDSICCYLYLLFVSRLTCYEMDKTSISMFEILEPRGQLWANTAFEGSQFHEIGAPKFYS